MRHGRICKVGPTIGPEPSPKGAAMIRPTIVLLIVFFPYGSRVPGVNWRQ
jgi:hypothetical protein